LGLLNSPDPCENFKGDDAAERIMDCLLSNPAIYGDVEIAQKIFQSSTQVGFREGDQIIRQGDNDKDVFFLIEGAVDIIVDRKRITQRESALQVGELAAIDNKPRTASVRVRTLTVFALKLGRDAFLSIRDENAQFRERLRLDSNARFRERIAASATIKENSSDFWNLVSLVSAVAVAFAAFSFSIFQQWGASISFATGTGAGVIVLIAFMIMNPAYFWRRIAYVSGMALIVRLTIDNFVQFDTGNNPARFNFRISTNFENFDATETIIVSVALLSVTALAAYKDRA
jgi:CRP-like cAMP-binding protein